MVNKSISGFVKIRTLQLTVDSGVCDIVNFSRFALTTVEGLTVEKSFSRSPYGVFDSF